MYEHEFMAQSKSFCDLEKVHSPYLSSDIMHMSQNIFVVVKYTHFFRL